MRRLLLVAVPVVLAVTLVGGVALAVSDSPRPDDVVRLWATADPEGEAFVPAVGGAPAEGVPPALGDVLVLKDNLFLANREGTGPRGDQVGTNSIVCTFTRVEVDFSGDLYCEGVLKLPPGDLTFQGLIAFAGDGPPDPFHVAITGGTRHFADAGGQALITEFEDGSSYYQVHLQHSAR